MRAMLFAIGLLTLAASPAIADERGEAIFSGGCFWCFEVAYKSIPGVTSVTSGYTGGTKAHPSYEDVSSGSTGHIESVHVVYDPKKVSYARLLDVFWHNVDPLQQNGQFCDHGTQYRSAIFYFDDAQHKAADASKQAIEQKLGAKTTTLVAPAQAFYDAEDYHQQFYKKNPEHYESYRAGCGRDERLHQLWGKDAGGH